MDCREACEHLELLATDDLSDPVRVEVQSHLRDCPACAAIADDYRILVAKLRSTPPGDSAAALIESICAATSARRSRARYLVPWSTALAATLLAAVLLWRLAWSDRAPGPVADAPAAVSLRQVWQHTGARAVPVSDATAVVVRGSNVYLVQDTETGTPSVVALDAASGQVRWQADHDSLGYLAADDEHVYCLAPADAGLVELLALNARTGEPDWSFRQDGPTRLQSPSRPLALDDGFVCWTTNTTIHMLKSADGSVAWSRPIRGEGLVSQPASLGPGLCVASGAAVYALSPRSGEILWRQDLPAGSIRLGRPLLSTAADRAFVARRQPSGQSQIVCLDATTHRPLWTAGTPAAFHVLADRDTLLVREQGVIALDANTGQRRWTQPANGCGPVTLADGWAYFVDTAEEGRLVALDRRTGQPVWQMAGIRSCEPFIPVRDTGLLKSAEGVLQAVALTAIKR